MRVVPFHFLLFPFFAIIWMILKHAERSFAFPMTQVLELVTRAAAHAYQGQVMYLRSGDLLEWMLTWIKRWKADNLECLNKRYRCWFRIIFSAAPEGGSLNATSSALVTSLCNTHCYSPHLSGEVHRLLVRLDRNHQVVGFEVLPLCFLSSDRGVVSRFLFRLRTKQETMQNCR